MRSQLMAALFAAMLCAPAVAGAQLSPDAQRVGSTSGTARLLPPGPAPTSVQGTFRVNAVDLAWTPAPGAQSYTIVRGFAGMNAKKTFTTTNSTFSDLVGNLPPFFPIDYEIFANYADKSPGRAALMVRTPDTHPVSDVQARLEGNGRRVKVTWSPASTIGYPLDHLYLAGVDGTPRSRTVPASASSVTLSALPSGTYTYAMLGYYSVPGVGVVESNPETAPQFTFRIPHCVLMYQRWQTIQKDLLGPTASVARWETLLLGPKETVEFNTSSEHDDDAGTESARYGSRFSRAKNDGSRAIMLTLENPQPIGGFPQYVLKRAEERDFENPLYTVALRSARCVS